MIRLKKAALLLPVFFLLFISLRPQPEKTYSNPVLVETYPIKRASPAKYNGTLGIGDPHVIHHEGTYYLYPTGDNHGYNVYLSEDLVHWTKGPRVFQTAENGVWAPDVFFNPDDRMFYLYYTANGRIGIAVSDSPTGVFRDMGIIVPGAIDAHMFRDEDGSYFLYYATYPEFALFVQPMESPVRRKGEPVELLSASEAWEMTNRPVIEAPWMLRYKGLYYLLYSGGSADTEHYAIGYATAKNPAGPFTKYPGNPVVRKQGRILGPGHASVTLDLKGSFWVVYHQQKDATRGWNRIICIDRLRFDEQGVLHIEASRGIEKPAPVTKAVMRE